VRVRTGGESRELAMAALFAAGSQGVLEEPDALLTHFPPETDVARVRAAVLDAVPGAVVELDLTDGSVWAVAW
jgi:ribosomal protein L11 methyltransferase